MNGREGAIGAIAGIIINFDRRTEASHETLTGPVANKKLLQTSGNFVLAGAEMAGIKAKTVTSICLSPFEEL